MIVVRFYSQVPYLEPLAKYIHENDPGENRMREMCRPVVLKLDDGDSIDVMNNRITELNEQMVTEGFERVSLVSEKDYDKKAESSYDIVMDTEEKTVTILHFKISSENEDIDKKLLNKYVIGKLLH